MKIIADANVLLRALLADDLAQAACATDALDKAELVAISLQTFCEFVWVLVRRYGMARADVAEAVRSLTETRGAVIDRAGVDAGLAALEAGGDFADGVVAYQGRWLGGETFVSFDRKAVRIVKDEGYAALLLH